MAKAAQGDCQRCWDDAHLRHLATGESQWDAYLYLCEVRAPDPAERRRCEEYQRSGGRGSNDE